MKKEISLRDAVKRQSKVIQFTYLRKEIGKYGYYPMRLDQINFIISDCARAHSCSKSELERSYLKKKIAMYIGRYKWYLEKSLNQK